MSPGKAVRDMVGRLGDAGVEVLPARMLDADAPKVG
jgi:hypothetical protein